MKSRILATALAICLALGASACSNNAKETTTTTKAATTTEAAATTTEAEATTAEPTTSSVKEITIVSNKVEIDEALKAYAKVYEEQSGVKVNVKSYGGETPYATSLTTMFQSGEEPEIFAFEGKSGYDEAVEGGRITILSDQPWVSDTGVAYYDADSEVIGFPVAIEGWGLGYNKALLAQAGVDPSSMVNIAGIKAAFETINSKKADLGIEAVVSMVAGPGMTWVTGLHSLNAYLTLGLPYNNSRTYIDMMLNKEVDTTRLTKYAEYVDLLFQNSIKNTLITGGYDQQLGDFAVGNTVFIHQGNWVDPTFKELGIDFEMGYVPHAYLDDTTDGIFVAAPSWYIINAKSKGPDAAKDFLAAMASTPEGHDYMVNQAGMVPAFQSCKLRPSGPLSQAVQEWSSAGKIYAWQQNEMPDGFGMNTLGPIYSQLAAGEIDVARFVEMFSKEVSDIKANP